MTAAMMSFQAEKRCHLMSAHAASARHICSSVGQFLIHSPSVLVWRRTTVKDYTV